MKEKPFPHISIPNFVENEALVRAAAESFEQLDSWVEYGDGENDGQIQYCSELGRKNYPPAALAVLDYICENFDPNDYFVEQLKCFPDHEFYGGGMMNRIVVIRFLRTNCRNDPTGPRDALSF